MSILFVINALNTGGAETFLMRLMLSLKQQHKLFVYEVSPELRDDHFAQYFLTQTGATLVAHPPKLGKVQEYILWKINSLLTIIGKKKIYDTFTRKRKENYFKNILLRKYNIDLINSHLFSSDEFSINTLKPIIKKPVVITMQGCYDSIASGNDTELINRAKHIILNADGMTYVANKNLEIFKRTNCPILNINALVYNGLPEANNTVFKKRESIGLLETDFVIGQVSRSIETKGMEIAIMAVELLVEQNLIPNAKLVLVGPENEYYKMLHDKYKDKQYIIFPGSALNPIEMVGMFDLGILPTYFPGESCPSTIVEYLSCGKPVVSTTIGEIPRMIEYGGKSAGKLVEYNKDNGRPSVDEISDKILEYYTDKQLYAEHSALAINAFAKFKISISAASYLEVYHNVLSHNQV